MSKNIDEMLDKYGCSSCWSDDNNCSCDKDKAVIKSFVEQAIERKELCLPLAVDDIVVLLNKYINSAEGKSLVSNREIAIAIASAQGRQT